MRRAFPGTLVLAGFALALTAVIALGVAGAWYATRDSSPVGHFRSAPSPPWPHSATPG
jgi:hypothetical protein